MWLFIHKATYIEEKEGLSRSTMYNEVTTVMAFSIDKTEPSRSALVKLVLISLGSFDAGGFAVEFRLC